MSQRMLVSENLRNRAIRICSKKTRNKENPRTRAGTKTVKGSTKTKLQAIGKDKRRKGTSKETKGKSTVKNVAKHYGTTTTEKTSNGQNKSTSRERVLVQCVSPFVYVL